MKNLDWLKELKAGDQVVRVSTFGWSRNKSYDICTVVKITPSGRINLDRFGAVIDQKTGRVRGSDSSDYFTPLTREILEEIEHFKKSIVIEKILSNVDLLSQDKDKIDTLHQVLIDLDLKEKNNNSNTTYFRK
jgi:hypothetical protein